MSDPESAQATATQVLKSIEASPLSAQAWEGLLQRVRGQNDPLSIKSLEIIIDGLKRMEETIKLAEEKQQTPIQLSTISKGMFSRLAKAYNSPTLLKEIGVIYLRDLRLPSVALQHFDRSMKLGGPEKELRPLSEAAAVAAQRQIALTSGQQEGHSGIEKAQHAKPVAPNIIRKTGKILMPSRMSQTAVAKLPAPTAGAPQEAVKPLPATTAECLAEAEAAIQAGKLVRAEQLLLKANENPASNTEMWQAWTNLGQAYYDAGVSPRIEAAFAEAVKYDPDELASRFNLALGYHLNDKFDLALAEYNKANNIESKHPKVWCNLGVLYFQMDRFDQAELALRGATTILPEYARAWDNLGAACGAQDKLDEAVSACQRAIELRPDYPEAYFKMGIVHFTRHDLTQAAMEFQKAALLPALTAYSECFQAMIYARLEQVEAAEAALQRAVKADAKCELLWMAWNDLGIIQYATGNYTKAAAAYGEATMLKPDEAGAWFNLGVSYHQNGDLAAAKNSYQHAVDLKESLASAWHNLGIILTEEGDHQSAANAFRQEVNWDSTNVRAWYDLSVSLEKLGEHEEAKVAKAKVDMLSQQSLEAPAA
jgi:superkiller protein 3